MFICFDTALRQQSNLLHFITNTRDFRAAHK